MVKWVCQTVTLIRHRVLFFDIRLFDGNTAIDTLVTGSISHFCRSLIETLKLPKCLKPHQPAREGKTVSAARQAKKKRK